METGLSFLLRIFILVLCSQLAFAIIWITICKLKNIKTKQYISNKLGYEIINEMRYSIFIYFYAYLCVRYIKENDKYGFYFNRKNIISPVYDEVKIYKKFTNDMIPVKKDGKWGFVKVEYAWKHKMYEAIAPQYDTVEDFSEIRALVTLNGEKFYINRNGKRM